MRRLEYTAAFEGQAVIVFPQLKGKRIITVEVDGYGMGKILSSGTPVNKEVKVLQFGSYASIYFGVPLARGSQTIIKYED